MSLSLSLSLFSQVLVYLGRGKLPWQGVQGTNKQQRYERICEIKLKTKSTVSRSQKVYVLRTTYST